jgi:hypothetical protein
MNKNIKLKIFNLTNLLLVCILLFTVNCKKENAAPSTTKNPTLSPDTCDVFIGNYMFTDSTFDVNNPTVFSSAKTYPISIVKDNSKVAGIIIYNLFSNGTVSYGEIQDTMCLDIGAIVGYPVILDGIGFVSGNKFFIYYSIYANPDIVYYRNRGTAIKF